MPDLIPAANWHTALTDAIRAAAPGDTIIVRTEPMLRLGETAARRMGKNDVTFKIAEVHDA